jgi:hypothetical protein
MKPRIVAILNCVWRSSILRSTSSCMSVLASLPASGTSTLTPLMRGFEIQRWGHKLMHSTAKRDTRFAHLQLTDIEWFQDVLGDGGVVMDDERLDPHNK